MEILKSAIFYFCSIRKGASFCPSEVVRKMYPQDWRHFMPDIQMAMMDMYQEGKINVTQKGVPIPTDIMPKGPVRISPLEKLS